MKRMITIGLLSAVLATGCQHAETSSQVVEGVLKYHKPGDKDIQSWYGHNYVVDGTPILPTDAVPEDRLKALTGKQVRVVGKWHAGATMTLSEEELNSQIPAAAAETGSATIGDGLRAESIKEVR